MVKRIEFENEILEFPDETPDQEIEAVLSQEYEARRQPQITPQQPQIGKVEAAITGLGQGATLGFGEEIVAGLSSPFIYGVSRLAEGLGYDTQGLADKTLREIYQEEVEKLRTGIREAQEQQPGAFLGGEIAGSIAGLGKVAKTGAGQAISSSLRKGALPQRAAKAGTLGATTSALYGAGTAEEGERLEEAQEAAITGGPLAAAFPVAGSLLKAKPALKTADQIKSLANDAYKKAAEQGGILKASFTDKFIKQAQKAKPQTTAGRILGGDAAATKTAKKLEKLRGKQLNLEEVQEIDEFLSDRIESELLATGSLNKQGKKILDIQTELRSMVEKAPISDIAGSKEGFRTLNEARKLWAKSMRLNDIQRIIQKAQGAENEATVIKNGFRALANNPKRLRGFTPKERKLIEKAANSGIMTDALKALGSRLIPIGAMVTGGNAARIAAAQLGTKLSREGATKTQQLKAKRIIDEIVGSTQLPQQQLPSRYPLAPGAVAPIIGGENAR